MMNEEKAKKYAELAIEKLRNETKLPFLGIDLAETQPSIFDSKIGGTPYLPRECEIPTSKNGRQMKLLAQINCKNLVTLAEYPHNGILQFFLTTDPMWDESFVKYYPEIDTSLTEAEILPRIQNFHEGVDGAFPVKGEYGMLFTPKLESMSSDDYYLQALFCQNYTEISGEYISNPEDAGNGEYGEVVYKIFEAYSDNAHSFGTKIGGYESSTQPPDYFIYQPKEYASPHSHWKTYVEKIDMKSDDTVLLLFQSASHYHNSKDYKVLWGDAGVARFCIKRKDLKNCDFSNVWFSWDCS